MENQVQENPHFFEFWGCWRKRTGEKQRVAIARAIVQEPKLLLVDEPTGSLDEENKKDVLKMLKHIHEKGTNIVIVIHDRGIAYQCDDKYYLQNGKIEIGKNCFKMLCKKIITNIDI